MITQEVTLLRIGLFGHSPLVKIIKTLQVAGHLEFLDYRNIFIYLFYYVRNIFGILDPLPPLFAFWAE